MQQLLLSTPIDDRFLGKQVTVTVCIGIKNIRVKNNKIMKQKPLLILFHCYDGSLICFIKFQNSEEKQAVPILVCPLSFLYNSF